MATKRSKSKAPVAKQSTLKPAGSKNYIHYHKDGSVWAKGRVTKGTMTGYWEWFRKDGTKLRSGYFTNGEQSGEWTTYDRKGRVYKVTLMKPKSNLKSKPTRASTKTAKAKSKLK